MLWVRAVFPRRSREVRACLSPADLPEVGVAEPGSPPESSREVRACLSPADLPEVGAAELWTGCRVARCRVVSIGAIVPA
eukprot:13755162-Alexandrium_andersonii.AAC.1